MQTNIGRCHYGGGDDATLIGTRPVGAGWIGVCDGHRDDAEREGYVLRAVAVEDETPRSTTEPPPRPTQPQPQPPVESSVGLDILDAPYPRDAATPGLR